MSFLRSLQPDHDVRLHSCILQNDWLRLPAHYTRGQNEVFLSNQDHTRESVDNFYDLNWSGMDAVHCGSATDRFSTTIFTLENILSSSEGRLLQSWTLMHRTRLFMKFDKIFSDVLCKESFGFLQFLSNRFCTFLLWMHCTLEAVLSLKEFTKS